MSSSCPDRPCDPTIGLLVVGDDNSLHTREVEVIKADEDKVILASGIEAGELVCLTALEFVVEGMAVDPVALDGTPMVQGPPPSPRLKQWRETSHE